VWCGVVWCLLSEARGFFVIPSGASVYRQGGASPCLIVATGVLRCDVAPGRSFGLGLDGVEERPSARVGTVCETN